MMQLWELDLCGKFTHKERSEALLWALTISHVSVTARHNVPCCVYLNDYMMLPCHPHQTGSSMGAQSIA
jgi:hypothetical protein